MKLDCYAVLGLSPAAEDVVIRAAYLALMRAYHPDRNGSAEAAARARTITEAYKTIGDPARRAEYDAGRGMHPYETLGYDEEPEPRLWRKAPAFRWPSLPIIRWPKLPVIPWPKMPEIQMPKAPVIGTVAASALAVVLAVAVLPMPERAQPVPAPTPASPTAKAEPAMRASEPVASVASKPRETNPPMQSDVAVPVQPPPARSEPAQAIADKPVPAKADVPSKPIRSAEVSSLPPAAQAAPAKPAPVDEKARVAALESMSTSFYNQSVSHADEARRSQLQQARDLFVNARNACKSDSCVGDAHASYIRDISRIMKKP